MFEGKTRERGEKIYILISPNKNRKAFVNWPTVHIDITILSRIEGLILSNVLVEAHFLPIDSHCRAVFVQLPPCHRLVPAAGSICVLWAGIYLSLM